MVFLFQHRNRICLFFTAIDGNFVSAAARDRFGLHAASAWVQFARGVPDSHLTFYTGPLSCYEGNPKETFL